MITIRSHILFKTTLSKSKSSAPTRRNLLKTFLFLINVHILDYPEPQFSRLFRLVPMSPDNRDNITATQKAQHFQRAVYSVHMAKLARSNEISCYTRNNAL